MKYMTLIIGCTLLVASCDSVSKYRIDDRPRVKLDTNLLGIWKCVEDSNKQDFILIQNAFDVFDAYYLSSKASEKDREYYKSKQYQTVKQEGEKYKDYYYYITRCDQSGTSPHNHQFTSLLSDVNNCKFLNVAYHNTTINGKNFSDLTHEEIKAINNKTEKQDIKGYFFVRILKINKGHDTVETTVFRDTALENLTSSAEVRQHVTQYLNSPAHYNDTMHFVKVSRYHEDINKAMQKANEK